MSIIDWEKDETVATIMMNNGENRLNPSSVTAMLHAFDEIEKHETIGSVVIASADPKSWSQGLDTPWIMARLENKEHQALKDLLYGVNRIWKRILLYPMPVIAAINGHTFGFGGIMACACDFRFMKADRGWFCFPSIDVDAPVLPSMLAIAKKAFPYHKLEEAFFTGKRMDGGELEAHDVIIKSCADDEELRREALSLARTFSKKRPVFAEMKRRFHKEIIDIIDQDDPVYIEPLNLWV